MKHFTMHGKMFEDQNINGWMASEKLDGCRGMWLPNFPPEFSNDPETEPTGLWSRDGKVIHAPKWWTQHLPKDIPLDGELYLDRKSFQTTMSIVRKKRPVVNEWQYIKFMAFEMPVLMEEGDLRFKNTTVKIPKIQLHPTISYQPPFRFVYKILIRDVKENEICKIVPQRVVNNKKDVEEFLDEVVSQGGEGLMLRDPFSCWEQNRSGKLLKVKPTHFMEVEVTGYYYGDGKYYGKMGALEVKDKNGRVFKVSGFTDLQRKVETVGVPFTRSKYNDCFFKIGSKIRIKYRELTDGGLPKEARYEDHGD